MLASVPHLQTSQEFKAVPVVVAVGVPRTGAWVTGPLHAVPDAVAVPVPGGAAWDGLRPKGYAGVPVAVGRCR